MTLQTSFPSPNEALAESAGGADPPTVWELGRRPQRPAPAPPPLSRSDGL